MKSRFAIPLLFISCMMLLIPLSILTAEETTTTDRILTRLEEKYTGKSFEANFKQATTITAVGISDEASGKVWFSHPGKMRWQYLQPHHHEFITDGETLWFYQPLEEQVSIGSAKAAFEDGVGGAFLSDFSRVRRDNTTSIINTTDLDITLELIPKKQNPRVKSIEIQFSRADFMIRQVTIINEQEDVTRFEFDQIHFGDSHPSMFSFTPPAGTTIIQH